MWVVYNKTLIKNTDNILLIWSRILDCSKREEGLIDYWLSIWIYIESFGGIFEKYWSQRSKSKNYNLTECWWDLGTWILSYSYIQPIPQFGRLENPISIYVLLIPMALSWKPKAYCPYSVLYFNKKQ